ncbi:hypothetical protein EBN03_01865 [Nocardia stercoris]|uniref:Nuclease SbcCD subunit C n=1 Tax=Nocardia stercoris TaxID=2483361 RepID=A0A3M2LEB8_9NOCA|nr:hypothetical protein EBN03_01865 [Nocardia stercoris]
MAADPAVTPEVAAAVRAALGAEDAADEQSPGSGIFVRAIRVRGFRGIGPAAALELDPGPGLTLVVGRNGSGKSSFAEAAELALTGDTRRWSGRAAVWRDGWRNLHEGNDTRIELELVAAGEPELRITREWTETAEFADGTWTEQRHGRPPGPFRPQEWAAALELYRPFLSYSELGALVDGRPADLFDALHRLLGLDQLTAAQERLRARRLELERAARAVGEERAALAAALGGLVDERAIRVAALLGAPDPDLTAVAAEIDTVRKDPGGIDRLLGIVALQLPAADVVAAAAADLVARAEDLSGHSGAEADLRVLELLRRAGEFAAAEPDACPCPVCGKGTLDAQWRRAADEQMDRLAQAGSALTTARADLDRALRAAGDLVKPVPAELDSWQPPTAGVDPAPAAAAWAGWAACAHDTHDPAELARRLPAAHAETELALRSLRHAATKELDRIDAVWAPLLPRLRAWLEAATTVAVADAELRTVRRAEEWLKTAAADLREQRMAPLADHARRIWTGLRQQSNVDLGTIRLQGTANAGRRVVLDVTVDDAGGTALGVMSQGELHALGLSLFLPRATVPDSPFGFLLIDDPVQAMDPAKVDGLARVLAAAARSGRQVVVFTHDARLAESVRRLRLPATIREVQRREGSRVEVRAGEDPVRRYLADANALLRTRQLPRDIAVELVVTCCRSAIEAAALARIRRDLIGAGIAHAEVQRRIDRARTVWEKLALAELGAADQVDELNDYLDAEHRWVRQIVRDAAAGAHIRIDRDPADLLTGTRRVVAWLDR